MPACYRGHLKVKNTAHTATIETASEGRQRHERRIATVLFYDWFISAHHQGISSEFSVTTLLICRCQHMRSCCPTSGSSCSKHSKLARSWSLSRASLLPSR